MEKIVVSNTSPLVSLSRLGRLQLLKKLWERVYIPSAVMVEVVKKEPGRTEVEKAVQEGWIIAKEVQNRTIVEVLLEIFGPGESECLALAKEMGAHLLIVDEKRARKTAKKLDLKITGVVGILVKAMQKGLLTPEELGSSVEILQKSGFRLSEELVLWVKERINDKLCKKR